MAKYVVPIVTDVEDQKLGRRTTYSIRNGIFSVYYKGRRLYSVKAKYGDVLIVNCEGGRTNIQKKAPPVKTGDLIAWLLGFNKNNRGQTEEEYEALMEEYRQQYYTQDYIEWEEEGKHYRFMKCSKGDFVCYNVASWVEDDITKEEILYLIPQMVYPHNFEEKILFERCGITRDEFQKAVVGLTSM